MTSRFSRRHIRSVLASASNAEAARLLGVSRERTRQLRAEFRVPVPRNARRLTVLKLLRAGKTSAWVAGQVGLSVSQVNKIGRAAGLPARPPPLAPCGTRAAYARHLRRGEPVDTVCLEANRLTTLRRRGGAT